MIEFGTQVRATYLLNRTDAAYIRRDLAVAGFDFIAEYMSFIADMAIGARTEVHTHSNRSGKTKERAF